MPEVTDAGRMCVRYKQNKLIIMLTTARNDNMLL